MATSLLCTTYSRILGDVLREARQAAGLSKYRVEQITEGRWEARRIHAYEHGHCAMRVATLADLCALYDIPTAVILDRADTRYRAGLKPAVAEWQERRPFASLPPQHSTEVA